jgi:c-di-GMP-binding flagellar brake protein YcgR
MNSIANSNISIANDKTGHHIISHSTSYRIKSRTEINSLLGKLLKYHSLLSIRIDDNPRTFGSMILEMHSEKRLLVLDELYPRNELKKSILKNKLSIEAQHEGIEIQFKVQVEAIAEKDEIEYYRVSYPDNVFHFQRRTSYRVNVGISDSVPVALSTENDILLHAELRDISLGGVSARINSPTTEVLAVGDEIPTCIIHMPNGRKIVSSLEIARIDEGTTSQSIRIGARFIHIAAADRQELSKLIARLDRENIKKIKRLSGTN